MANAVRVVCPNLKCRAMLSIPGEARGKVVRCRKCGMRVNVPSPGTGQPASQVKAEHQATSNPSSG